MHNTHINQILSVVLVSPLQFVSNGNFKSSEHRVLAKMQAREFQCHAFSEKLFRQRIPQDCMGQSRSYYQKKTLLYTGRKTSQMSISCTTTQKDWMGPLHYYVLSCEVGHGELLSASLLTRQMMIVVQDMSYKFFYFAGCKYLEIKCLVCY